MKTKGITDANGNITKYSYDDLSRLTKVTNALGKTAEMTYDECGNVLTSTDFAGKLTSYTYDEFDRLASKTTKDGTVTYSYTVDGKLSSVKDSTGTTKYTYDSMDGLKKVVYPTGEYVEYTYDDSCRLTSVKTAYGTTSYSYDKLDRLVRVVDRNGYATLYEYDKNGNRSAVRYANGIVVSYKYDEVNRLISEKALDKQGGLVAQYEYTLGAAGERTKVKELDRTVEYTYDALYRLTGEKITAADKTVTEYTYAYDKVSNRILKTENGTKTTYTYNALNQLVKENDTVYKYDDAGNLISTTSSGNSAAYTYNAENKLIRATVQEGNNVSVEEYEYDYAGNRIVKKSENNYTYYLNDVSGSLTQVLAELDSNGNEKCYYTRGIEIISQERSGNISYYLTDGHGSVRQLADSTGAVTDTYIYDAWGNLISSTGTTENSYLYCGEQLDSTTGLYYLRARYMNPNTGTFISMDTYQGSLFEPVTLHKYLYANANPVMNVDPSGYTSYKEILTTQNCMSILAEGFAVSAAFALAFYRNFRQSNIIDVIGEILDISGYVERFLAENLTVEIVRILDAVREYILSNVELKVEQFQVGAVFIINGTIYSDINPKARINIQIGTITLPTPRGTTAVNRLLPSSHAEIGVMHQALIAGEEGGIGKLIVTDKPICPYCRIDIKKLAIALQLDELIVYDMTGKYVFDGTKNEFNNVSSGGKSWPKARVD